MVRHAGAAVYAVPVDPSCSWHGVPLPRRYMRPAAGQDCGARRGRNKRRWSLAGRWRRPRRREPEHLAQLPCRLLACATPPPSPSTAQICLAWVIPYPIALEQDGLAAIPSASRVLPNPQDLAGFLIAARTPGQNCGAAIPKTACRFCPPPKQGRHADVEENMGS